MSLLMALKTMNAVLRRIDLKTDEAFQLSDLHAVQLAIEDNVIVEDENLRREIERLIDSGQKSKCIGLADRCTGRD